MEQELQQLRDDFQKHNHNGLNSDAIDITSFVTFNIIAGGNVFIATRPCMVRRVSEVHTGTATGSTVVEKLTGTTAVGSGTKILTADFSLAVAAETITNGVLTNNNGIPLSKGDRIASYVSGSSSGVTNQCLTFEIKYS